MGRFHDVIDYLCQPGSWAGFSELQQVATTDWALPERSLP